MKVLLDVVRYVILANARTSVAACLVISGTSLLVQNVLVAVNVDANAMEIPTIQCEQEQLHDEFLFADSGTNATGDTITITEAGADHPLAAGLGLGDILVRNSPTDFHVASANNLAEAYEIVAEINGNPAIGVVEPGGWLKDGTTATSARIVRC